MLERGPEGVFQCGREITSQELDEIKETVDMFPRLSRSELAATICEYLEWMTASGDYKKDACIKLLEKLESGGLVTLPDGPIVELCRKNHWDFMIVLQDGNLPSVWE